MPPAEPIALDILQALVARLQAIVVGDDYHTSAGANVSVGWLSEDPGTLALAVHSTNGRARGDTVKSRVTEFLDVVVTARIPTPAGDSVGVLAEKVVADIQTAIEDRSNHSLGGLAQLGITYQGRTTIGPPKGGTIAWAYLTYQVGYHRGYGSPASRA